MSNDVENQKEPDIGSAEAEQTLEEVGSKENCEIDENNEELEILKKELLAQKDRLLRTMAEYENFRKRTEREKTAIYADATSMAVSLILPVADSLDRALEVQSGSAEEYQKGIEMVKAQFSDALQKLSVESFGEKGEPFNPDLHNAVAHIEDDQLEENVISAVFQKGYKIDDRIIRHAMVQVAN